MKTKLGLIALVGVLAFLGLPVVVNAQCTAFGVGVLADGRPTTITVPFNGSGTFVQGVLFRAAPGRSYSVEVFTPEFLLDIGEVFLGAANDTSCPLTNGPGVRDIRDVEPRASFIWGRFGLTVTAPITNQTTPSFFIRMRNASTTTAQTVTVTVTDTTQFHPGWSTGGGFNTFYSIQNTTNASCSITLTLFNLAGTQVATTTQSVTAGALLATNTQMLGVGAGLAGTGILTHDCPPGGILVDAAIANFGTSPAAIIPAKFQPVRQMR